MSTQFSFCCLDLGGLGPCFGVRNQVSEVEPQDNNAHHGIFDVCRLELSNTLFERVGCHYDLRPFDVDARWGLMRIVTGDARSSFHRCDAFITKSVTSNKLMLLVTCREGSAHDTPGRSRKRSLTRVTPRPGALPPLRQHNPHLTKRSSVTLVRNS